MSPFFSHFKYIVFISSYKKSRRFFLFRELLDKKAIVDFITCLTIHKQYLYKITHTLE